MRAGLTVSIIGHVALLGFGFIAFPDALPLKVEDIEALPVDLVSVAVGAFADPNFPAPVRTVWAKTKHAWLAFPEDVPVHQEAPG